MSNTASAIIVNNVNFFYNKNEPILKNININVPKGSIYGFLGSNGAGKSTTIRVLLGLILAQSGKVCLFGKDPKINKVSTFKKIGSLIENPSLYQHLDAVENLKITCKYHNISYKNINNTLSRVGLLGAKKKKVKNYSMGMKQRLGLAMAIIHNPDLLILDEPTNGLDPNGINEIRNVILELKNEGKTIMLSSHLLNEIEKIATHVGIIQNGSLIFEGLISQLESHISSQIIVKISTKETLKANRILSEYNVVSSNQNYIEVQLTSKGQLSKTIALLVSNNIPLGEIQFRKKNLESLFMDITNKS